MIRFYFMLIITRVCALTTDRSYQTKTFRSLEQNGILRLKGLSYKMYIKHVYIVSYILNAIFANVLVIERQ